MIWPFILCLGITLWCVAHLFKRLAPKRRAAMDERMGRAARGMVATAVLVSVALMVIGYRGMDGGIVYEAPDWGRHANNTLMAVAILLFGVGSSKSRARGWIRHPMLTGFLLWAIAHMLVNGDSASIALFGSLGLWAIVEMLVIDHAEPDRKRFQGGTLAGDLRLLAISATAFAAIAALHAWLGPNPFGR